MLHKKGVIWETLLGLITILAVVALVYFFVGGSILPLFYGTVKKEVCKESVLTNAKLKIGGFTPNFPLKCARTNITIDSSDALRADGSGLKEIADSMYDCWDQFGAGEVDFLDDWHFGKADTFCFICSKIEFDKSIKGNSFNLGDYLKGNNIPIQDSTYAEYFSKTKNTKLDLSFLNNLKTDKPFYILFFAKKGFDISTLYDWKSGGVAAIGCAAGAKVGGAIGALFFLGGAIPAIGIGCAGGAIVSYSTYALTEKKEYVPGMRVTDSEEVVKICKG